jgi:hypothetical protein
MTSRTWSRRRCDARRTGRSPAPAIGPGSDGRTGRGPRTPSRCRWERTVPDRRRHARRGRSVAVPPRDPLVRRARRPRPGRREPEFGRADDLHNRTKPARVGPPTSLPPTEPSSRRPSARRPRPAKPFETGAPTRKRDADPGPPPLPGEITGADGLSPEPQAFAHVLGRLLARRWHETARSGRSPRRPAPPVLRT